ncbi:MAG: hypothetical protein KGI73_02225 [Patescibacteria group bacterium]|nr:hypothetical protein [Patescibacteria group bacterium]
MANGTEKKKNGAPSRKRFTLGLEVEFFIIDKSTGRPVPRVEDLIRKVEEKAGGKEHAVVREFAAEMIEVGSYQDVEGSNTMKSLIENVRLLAYAADEMGLALLPLGSYPGKFTPHVVRSAKSTIESKLSFPRGGFLMEGRYVGFHCHYALPWGVFDAKELALKNLSDSKNQEILVNAYNFLIALDPVLTTFMQSSPFLQGRMLAKDSRMIAMRSDSALGDFPGWFAKHPILATLPPYVHTGTDINHLVEQRTEAWLLWNKEAGTSAKDALAPFKSQLKINWSPLRINPHGTFEQRGMDMNRLPVLLSVAILIQVLLRSVQEGSITVVPHDSAKKEPFSLEGKQLFIAPDAYVRNHLQRLSAYEGLANDEMYQYCKRAVGLAKTLGGEKVEPLLKPLTTMLTERQTTADKVLAQARELGYKDKRKALPQSIASEIALAHAKQMFEDIVLLGEMIEANNRLSA